MTQKRTLKTTKQICSFLELAPTTFYKARKMANLKAYEGTGTRYDPYLYDLLEARVAWTDYQRAIVSRKAVKKGLPRNLGGVRMGDFSSGEGRKPVVLKPIEKQPPKPEPARAVFNPETDGSMMAWLSEQNTIAHAREGRKTAVSKNN